ncbi:hypothetical protein Tco_1023824 [Tanacetum coccineum]
MPFLSTGITSYRYWLSVVSSCWSFASTVPGQMTYPVASLTLDSARSYVMQAVEKGAMCMPYEASDAKFKKCLFLIIPYSEQVVIGWTKERSGGALLSKLVHAIGLGYRHQSLDYRHQSVEESRHQIMRKT